MFARSCRCVTPVCLLLALLAGCSDGVHQPPATLQMDHCRLASGSGIRSVAAQCGVLAVPENPAEPTGKTIDIKVARVPAISPQFPGTAVTVIAGGPGQASTEFFADYAHAWERINQHHDILLVDQRGTGASNALDCDFDIDPGQEFQPGLARDLAQQCLQQLPGDARYYTTSVAVRDLDAARQALGYRQLNVYGASYGTRVALHYLRRYPDHTRSVILDGVIAADQVIGPDIANDADRALREIFARCADDEACRKTFGDPAAQMQRLRDSLRTQAVEVQLPDPVTAEPIAVSLNHDALAGAVRLLSYDPATAALLPLLIHEAAVNRNFQPLAAQAKMSMSSIADSLNEGMHNAVVCTEDVPFFEVSEQQRQQLRSTYLGELVVDSLQAVCSIWPAGEIDNDFHEPVESDTPVLLLSGALDPVTPPANADRAAATLSNSLHIVAPGHGHGVLAINCIPQLMRVFIDNASVEAVDPECVAGNVPDPFFLRFTGPAP